MQQKMENVLDLKIQKKIEKLRKSLNIWKEKNFEFFYFLKKK